MLTFLYEKEVRTSPEIFLRAEIILYCYLQVWLVYMAHAFTTLVLTHSPSLFKLDNSFF